MWKKIIRFFFRPAAETAAAPVRKARKARKARKTRKVCRMNYYQPQLPLE